MGTCIIVDVICPNSFVSLKKKKNMIDRLNLTTNSFSLIALMIHTFCKSLTLDPSVRLNLNCIKHSYHGVAKNTKETCK